MLGGKGAMAEEEELLRMEMQEMQMAEENQAAELAAADAALASGFNVEEAEARLAAEFNEANNAEMGEARVESSMVSAVSNDDAGWPDDRPGLRAAAEDGEATEQYNLLKTSLAQVDAQEAKNLDGKKKAENGCCAVL